MKEHFSERKKISTNIWQIQEAKAKFSQLVQEANARGHQIITKQGEPIAVIISKAEYDKITHPKNSLLSFFKEAPFPEFDLDIQRSKELPRELDL